MNSWAYYNDNDPNICAWIRQLIKDRLVTDGEVDCRSIVDVQPGDLKGFTRHHFFSGICGWDYALQLAGWPNDERIVTASCPCQPLSCAGKRAGEKDERHLWPELYRLISECGFQRVLGEQVASRDGLEWIDGVSLDLEELGYVVWASDIPAAGVAAPQLRQRLYWVAFSDRGQRERGPSDARGERNGTQAGREQGDGELESCGGIARLADPNRERQPQRPERDGGALGREQQSPLGDDVDRCGGSARLAHAHGPRSQGRRISGDSPSQRTPWSNSVASQGDDGKWRRIEPGIPPLAARISGRVALIRGSGNSICPQLAAKFIQAALPEICQVGRADNGVSEEISRWDEAAFG